MMYALFVLGLCNNTSNMISMIYDVYYNVSLFIMFDESRGNGKLPLWSGKTEQITYSGQNVMLHKSNNDHAF